MGSEKDGLIRQWRKC